MSKLLEAQWQFTKMVAQLIAFASERGYQLSFGEVWRTPEQARLNAQKGIGIADSLHIDRLAVDFNLFREGQLLTSKGDFEPLGVFWESIGGAWGGRFASPDSDHFSLAFGGRK